jgi:hypothetical protein
MLLINSLDNIINRALAYHTRNFLVFFFHALRTFFYCSFSSPRVSELIAMSEKYENRRKE